MGHSLAESVGSVWQASCPLRIPAALEGKDLPVGPGPTLPRGPGPARMGYRPFRGTSAGPGPVHEIGPGPTTPSPGQSVTFPWITLFYSCSVGMMYLSGRFPQGKTKICPLMGRLTVISPAFLTALVMTCPWTTVRGFMVMS